MGKMGPRSRKKQSQSRAGRKKVVEKNKEKIKDHENDEEKVFQVPHEFQLGERVLCYEPDIKMARVLYDAKVLEVVERCDKKGKIRVEYKIHFYGWNSSWDRFVDEDSVLKDTDLNRELQRELKAEAERLNQNTRHKKKRKKTLSEILKEVQNKSAQMDQGAQQDSDDMSVESDSTDPYSSDEEGQPAHIFLTEDMKTILENDWENIAEYNKLVRLPAHVSIHCVFESYVKYVGFRELRKLLEIRKQYDHPPPPPAMTGMSFKLQPKPFQPPHVENWLDEVNSLYKKVNQAQEVVYGLKTIFDYSVYQTLLYDQENKQYECIRTLKPRIPMVNCTRLLPNLPVVGTWYNICVPMPKHKPTTLFEANNVAKVNLTPIDVASAPVLYPMLPPPPPQLRTARLRTDPGPAAVEELAQLEQAAAKPKQEVPQEPKLEGGKAVVIVEGIVPQVLEEKPMAPQLVREECKVLQSVRVGKLAPQEEKMILFDPSVSCKDEMPGTSKEARKALEQDQQFCQAQELELIHTDEKGCQANSVPGQPMTNGEPGEGEVAITPKQWVGATTIVATVGEIIEDPPPKHTFHPPLFADDITNVFFNRVDCFVVSLEAWNLVPEVMYSNRVPDPSMIYGIIHLLRFFTKLPDLINSMTIPRRKVRIIARHVNQIIDHVMVSYSVGLPRLYYGDPEEIIPVPDEILIASRGSKPQEPTLANESTPETLEIEEPPTTKTVSECKGKKNNSGPIRRGRRGAGTVQKKLKKAEPVVRKRRRMGQTPKRKRRTPPENKVKKTSQSLEPEELEASDSSEIEEVSADKGKETKEESSPVQPMVRQMRKSAADAAFKNAHIFASQQIPPPRSSSSGRKQETGKKSLKRTLPPPEQETESESDLKPAPEPELTPRGGRGRAQTRACQPTKPPTPEPMKEAESSRSVPPPQVRDRSSGSSTRCSSIGSIPPTPSPTRTRSSCSSRSSLPDILTPNLGKELSRRNSSAGSECSSMMKDSMPRLSNSNNLLEEDNIYSMVPSTPGRNISPTPSITEHLRSQSDERQLRSRGGLSSSISWNSILPPPGPCPGTSSKPCCESCTNNCSMSCTGSNSSCSSIIRGDTPPPPTPGRGIPTRSKTSKKATGNKSKKKPQKDSVVTRQRRTRRL